MACLRFRVLGFRVLGFRVPSIGADVLGHRKSISGGPLGHGPHVRVWGSRFVVKGMLRNGVSEEPPGG